MTDKDIRVIVAHTGRGYILKPDGRGTILIRESQLRKFSKAIRGCISMTDARGRLRSMMAGSDLRSGDNGAANRHQGKRAKGRSASRYASI